MVANVLEIDPERLWESLERSAVIGRFRDVGLRRLALSAEDKQMRDLFVDWAKAAGCTVEIDRLGNIFARRPGTDPSLPPVAIGSHLDTQICGGRYDGILGVLCGLEIVRTLNDRGLQTKRGIEVICWTNEEGARFNPPMMGSMAFAGVLPLESVLATTDDSGITVAEALDEIGYAGPAPVGREFDSYLELHIEQAPVLDREGCDVGIVVGGYKTQALRLTINGDTGHAGGTPMAQRRNALVGAGYVIAAVNDIGLAYAVDEGRTTTTRIESFPNLAGTYAEQVKLTIDFRHIDEGRFKAMRAEVDAAIAAAAKKANVEIEDRGGLELGQRAVRARMHRAAEVDGERTRPALSGDAQPGRSRCLCGRDDGADGDDLHALLRRHQSQRQRSDRTHPLGAGRQPPAERCGNPGESVALPVVPSEAA
jgi:N-carbamoyl-L-amino-acid hydrolase